MYYLEKFYNHPGHDHLLHGWNLVIGESYFVVAKNIGVDEHSRGHLATLRGMRYMKNDKLVWVFKCQDSGPEILVAEESINELAAVVKADVPGWILKDLVTETSSMEGRLISFEQQNEGFFQGTVKSVFRGMPVFEQGRGREQNIYEVTSPKWGEESNYTVVWNDIKKSFLCISLT